MSKSIASSKLIDKWGEKKHMAQIVSSKVAAAADAGVFSPEYMLRRSEAIGSCSRHIELAHCPDCGSLHVSRTWLCRDRLCPICNWRLSIQRASEMLRVMEYMRSGGARLSAAMLTLTVKNVTPSLPHQTVPAMLAAWKRMQQRRDLKRWVTGYARSLEVTYNRRSGEFHPHIHVLLIFHHSYDRHITQPVWAEWWREALGVDYTPVVDIRSAYDRKSSQSRWDALISASVEALKYATKTKILVDAPAPALAHLAHALKGRRLVCYAGCIKAARAALSLADADVLHQLDEVSLICPDCGATQVDILAYQWSQGAYKRVPS